VRRTGGVERKLARGVFCNDAASPSPAPVDSAAPGSHVKPTSDARRPWPVLLFAALVSLVPAMPSTAHATRLVVVQDGETPRLAKTLGALRESAGIPVEIVRLSASGQEGFEAALSRGEAPVVVVALGPRASDFILRQSPSVAAVHCLGGADALRAGLPAVPSHVPADHHAKWLRKLVPNATSVGVAFDPAMNTRQAEALAATLGQSGYRMLLVPVATPAALPGALESLAGRIDALVALADPTVYTAESARGILLFSFRKRIPLVGPNPAWVRMGALYALDWDYGEVGATCARLALRQVHSAKGAPAIAPPRPRVSVNLKSAGQFGLQWNEDLLHGVDARYE
jgi:putative ABC transport system substrate-binding protein